MTHNPPEPFDSKKESLKRVLEANIKSLTIKENNYGNENDVVSFECVVEPGTVVILENSTFQSLTNINIEITKLHLDLPEYKLRVPARSNTFTSFQNDLNIFIKNFRQVLKAIQTSSSNANTNLQRQLKNIQEELKNIQEELKNIQGNSSNQRALITEKQNEIENLQNKLDIFELNIDFDNSGYLSNLNIYIDLLVRRIRKICLEVCKHYSFKPEYITLKISNINSISYFNDKIYTHNFAQVKNNESHWVIEKRVDVLMEEYKTLRAEILQNFQQQNNIFNYGLAALGLAFAAVGSAFVEATKSLDGATTVKIADEIKSTISISNLNIGEILEKDIPIIIDKIPSGTNGAFNVVFIFLMFFIPFIGFTITELLIAPAFSIGRIGFFISRIELEVNTAFERFDFLHRYEMKYLLGKLFETSTENRNNPRIFTV